MGSSLGGVVSFFMAWQWPQVFGAAACLSSTFSHKDDLVDRVLTEPKNPAKFYIDSGWPGDNFETTLAMAIALHSRGYVYGQDFIHFAFPNEKHEETAWGSRLHLPLQLFWGKVSTARRGRTG
jgi:enterochelin esterase-like enzyme